MRIYDESPQSYLFNTFSDIINHVSPRANVKFISHLKFGSLKGGQGGQKFQNMIAFLAAVFMCSTDGLAENYLAWSKTK